MFLVYLTDTHHSYHSRDMIGCCTSLEKAIKICKKKAKKLGRKINEEQLWNLFNLKQTQGYSGDYEFAIEEVEINTLL